MFVTDFLNNQNPKKIVKNEKLLKVVFSDDNFF
jgi:hypothetical protein